MEDYKIIQDIYHRLNPIEADNLNNVDVVISSDILEGVYQYINDYDNVGWLYPAKSYIVGVCYALWLSEDFGVDFYKTLSDASLLYNNDPYFIPYLHSVQSKEIYDKIIKLYDFNMLYKENNSLILHIREYYNKEFFI